ncbi:MAG: ABC transporter substrate-binding protein [Candidatus Wallbacteria bacterium]|nr:ABC transporter substrate-binding protein [Candidatus Wallbacteria bacterium]
MTKITTILLAWLFIAPSIAGDFKIAAILDKTGPTSDVCLSYLQGIGDYLSYTGGRCGNNKISLISGDYQYIVPKSLQLFRKFVESSEVLAVIGWGTGDSILLSSLAESSEVLFVPASFADSLVSPCRKFTFNPFSTYNEEFKVLLQYIAADSERKSRKAKVAIVYHESGFGRSPLDQGRHLARKLGIGIVAEIPQSSLITDAEDIFNQLIDKKPDYVIIQDTLQRAALDLRDGKKVLPDAQFLGTYYTLDNRIFDVAGAAAEGFISVSPFQCWDYDSGEIRLMHDFVKTRKSPESMQMQYIQGWIVARSICDALKKAGPSPTRLKLRDAYESLTAYNTNGASGSVSFSPANHKGSRTLMLYRAGVKDRKFAPAGDWVTIPE